MVMRFAFDVELHKATQGTAAQFMLQPQYTENPHMVKNMKVPYCNFEGHL